MVKSRMNSKAINILVVLVTLPILFLALVFHVDALPANYVNTFSTEFSDACFDSKISKANGDCTATAKEEMTAENKVYVASCMNCADWATNYDGCGEYVTKKYKTPMSHTPLRDLHEQCKHPVVYYRTTKGYSTEKPANEKQRGSKIPDPAVNETAFREIYDPAILTKNNDRYVSYNRCDTIEDIVHTECQFIHGSACVTCEGMHCCGGLADENGTCLQGECPNHMCTGVNKSGSSAVSGCAPVDDCGECYTLSTDQNWLQSHGYTGEEIARWVCNVMPSDTVNAECDTKYGVQYDVDVCTKAKVKTSNYVCQKKYLMNIDGNLVDAYCVNPEYATAGDVEPDDSFDVTTCETSISTKNCGFANILIEGYLRKELGEYNGKDYYSIISQALQLWGAHVNEAGYNGAGMSPESIVYSSIKKLPSIPSFEKLDCSENYDEFGRASAFGIYIDVTHFNDYDNAYYRGYGEFMYNTKKNDFRTYRNIFKETSDNFDKYLAKKYNNIYEVKSSVDKVEIDGGKLKGKIEQEGLTSVNCSKLKDDDNKLLMGLCTQTSSDKKLSSYNKSDYLEALYLYANTIQGNRNMVDHLYALIAYKDASEDVTIESLKAVNNPTAIDVTLAEDSNILITYKIANNGRDMNCIEGEKYNGTSVCCSRNSQGNTCKVDQTLIQVKANGKTQTITTGIDKYDYCTSNGYCYLKVNMNKFSPAELCNADIDLKVNMQVLSSKSAIKRYEAAGSPSDRQSYFVLDYSHNSKDAPKETDVSTKIACSGCKESATLRTGYVITQAQAEAAHLSSPKEACLSQNSDAYYDEEKDICYTLVDDAYQNGSGGTQCINCIVDSKRNCLKDKNGNAIMVDDSINARRISDPSLNCIVNMSYNAADNKSKSFYEYSEVFGVNTDVCRVYCSDEVNIFLANKKDVYVGMHLKYDIEDLVEKAYGTTPKTNRVAIFNANKNKQFYNHGGRNDTNENLMLSAIVMQERKCVSKIFFNEAYDSSRDWETKYSLGEDAVGVNNWKSLYVALSKKAKSENERREILNQLLYDLYNCNMLNSDEIKSMSSDIVHKPVDRNNVYEYIVNKYKTTDDEKKDIISRGSGISDHRCGGKPCAGLTDGTSYTGGAQYITDYRTSHNRVGEIYGEPEMTYYTASNADINETKPITVLYCNKNECFRGPLENDGKYNEDYLAFHAINKDKISDAVGNGIKNFKGVNVYVPTNDYAVFTIQVRTDFYNSEIYQVENQSGKVKAKDDNKKYVTLGKFIYPVSIDAYQDGNCFSKDENGVSEKGRCQTLFKFTINPDSTRKSANDRFAQYLSKNDTKQATTYTCSYVAKSEVIRDGFVYRSISLKDPFPNKRSKPTNWSTEIAQEAISEIKASSDEIYKVSNMYLEYKYTITKKGLDNIRDNYNYDKDVKGEGYIGDEVGFGCLKADTNYKYMLDYLPKEDGTIYVQCKSAFLQALNDGEFEGVTVIKGDGISEYSQINRKTSKISQEGSGD